MRLRCPEIPASVAGTLAAILALTAAVSPARSADPPTAPPRALADTLFARQDWRGAVKAYESLVKADPGDSRAWYRLGLSRGSIEQWNGAIAAYRRAEALGIPPAFARFNVACAFARSGRADSAFATLESLVNGGFRQVAQLETDSDLAALRSDGRFAAILERARRNQTPCAFAPESRQFDFWVGDWEVRDNQRGQMIVGESHVELILDQCVVFENWTSRSGGTGKSFNAWNRQTRCWQQNWMDNAGTVTNFGDGTYDNGVMTLVASTIGPNGEPQKQRLSFHNLGPDRVRQHGELSVDGGVTWSTTYDYDYLRKPAAAR